MESKIFDLIDGAIPAMIALIGVIVGIAINVVRDYLGNREYYRRLRIQNISNLDGEICGLYVSVQAYLDGGVKPTDGNRILEAAKIVKAKALANIKNRLWRDEVIKFIDCMKECIEEYPAAEEERLEKINANEEKLNRYALLMNNIAKGDD